MTRFVALLRGIAPMNPNMRNERLRSVCEALGLERVETVISSGNVIFDSGVAPAEIETMLEAAWPEQLGFESTTILRSQHDIEELVGLEPFGDRVHGPETYLLVTFAKHPLTVGVDFPHQPDDRDYSIIGATEREVFSVTDTVNSATPDIMSWMERQYGREISSRTWLTVTRIVDRMRKG